MIDKVAYLCPVCFGCGHTSRGEFGQELPQPTFTSNDSTAPLWRKCIRCLGTGMVLQDYANQK